MTIWRGKIQILLKTYNGLRSHLVKKSADPLCKPLYKRYFLIGIYASLVWLESMCHPVAALWGIVESYELGMIIQLLLLSVCMGIMMGVALP